ncbi:hypothetical protein Tco_1407602 [Tanacetum coccineum]
MLLFSRRCRAPYGYELFEHIVKVRWNSQRSLKFTWKVDDTCNQLCGMLTHDIYVVEIIPKEQYGFMVAMWSVSSMVDLLNVLDFSPLFEDRKNDLKADWGRAVFRGVQEVSLHRATA